jgi:hypothetical protein
MARTLRFGFVSVLLCALSGRAGAFDQSKADADWSRLRRTAGQSTFLMDRFLTQQMPGLLSGRVKRRVGEIASQRDVTQLLQRYIDPSHRAERETTYSLLEQVVSIDLVALLDQCYRLAEDDDARHDLFNLLVDQKYGHDLDGICWA